MELVENVSVKSGSRASSHETHLREKYGHLIWQIEHGGRVHHEEHWALKQVQDHLNFTGVGTDIGWNLRLTWRIPMYVLDCWVILYAWCCHTLPGSKMRKNMMSSRSFSDCQAHAEHACKIRPDKEICVPVIKLGLISTHSCMLCHSPCEVCTGWLLYIYIYI